jgi:hypothetical protein
MKVLVTLTMMLPFLCATLLGADNSTTTTAGDDQQTTGAVGQSPKSGEQIKWQVIGSGGTRGTSTNYILFGTAGQTAVGQGTSTNFQVNQGFWQNFAPGFICGDANANGIVNIADVVYLIQYIFAGGPAPNPLASGDVNCSGIVNIADVVYLIQYIFAGGPEPCAAC